MPYMIVPRKNKYYVHKRGADGQPEGRALGTHDFEANANAQLAVLARAFQQEQDAAAKYAGIDFRAPDTVRACAQRGLASGGGSDTQRALASQIASGQPLTARAVRQMAKRAAASKGDENDPAYLMCGGNAGAVWARSVCQKMDEAETMKRTKAVPDSVLETLTTLAMNTNDDSASAFGMDSGEVAEAVIRMAKTLGYLEDGELTPEKVYDMVEKIEPRQKNKKTLTTSDSGSLGFGVDADTEGLAARAATAKYRKGSLVVVKAINQRGTVVSVRPLKSGPVVYGIKTTDGFALATAGELTGAGKGTAKADNPLLAALEAKEQFLQKWTQGARNLRGLPKQELLSQVRTRIHSLNTEPRSEIIHYILSERYGNVERYDKAIVNAGGNPDRWKQQLTKLRATGTKQTTTAAAKTVLVLASIRARQKAAITPYRQVINRVIRQAAANSKADESGVGNASGQHAGAKVSVRYNRKVGTYTINVESAKGQSHTFTSGQMLNAIQFMAGNTESTMSAGKAESTPDPAKPADVPTPTKAVKALADAIAQVTDPAQTDSVDNAFEVVRIVTHATGNAAAVKAVVDLEETVYADAGDDVAAWRAGVMAKIAAYEQTVKALETEEEIEHE